MASSDGSGRCRDEREAPRLRRGLVSAPERRRPAACWAQAQKSLSEQSSAAWHVVDSSKQASFATDQDAQTLRQHCASQPSSPHISMVRPQMSLHEGPDFVSASVPPHAAVAMTPLRKRAKSSRMPNHLLGCVAFVHNPFELCPGRAPWPHHVLTGRAEIIEKRDRAGSASRSPPVEPPRRRVALERRSRIRPGA